MSWEHIVSYIPCQKLQVGEAELENSSSPSRWGVQPGVRPTEKSEMRKFGVAKTYYPLGIYTRTSTTSY